MTFTDIHIRCNTGRELALRVLLEQDTIAHIKQEIRKYAPEKTIRLIHRGQLLTAEKNTLYDYGIQEQNVFIHCALSDPIIPTNTIYQEEEPSIKHDPLAGFNKLRESGYNDEEIRSIRLQFHRLQSTSDYVDGEPPTEEQIQLEQEWMEHSGRQLPDGSGNSFKEMVCGLLLGCFLGVLCLFWVRESVFTRRHQLGILAGMLINVSCGINYVYY